MDRKKKALGQKGLGAIFGTDTVEEVNATPVKRNEKNAAEEKGGECMMKLSLIEPNKEQPRKNFKDDMIQELADSIKQYGVLQPLLVQKKDRHYEIIAGERRYRAAKTAGLKEVPVIIREYSRQETMEIALIENVQRADLNPVEEALAYQRLMQEFHMKQEEIAERVSKNRATITNSMRLLKLCPAVRELLIREEISGGHARALLGIENSAAQEKLAKRIVEEKLSVRDVERLVKVFSKKDTEKEKPVEDKKEKDLTFIYKDLEEKMKTAMGTKVHINRKDKNKGRIEIEYYSSAELERLVEMIESVQN